MEKLCIFAGTTEGRSLVRALRGAYRVTACVATEYGRETLAGIEGVRVLAGRMDADGMAAFFRENRFSRVLDATHPYAREATENIRAACERTGTPLLRVLRDTGADGGAVTVGSVREAAEFLAGREGRVLLTTGSRELSAFAGLDPGRVWARVLPLSASLAACAEAGLPASHVIAMQGPFSREMNAATLRQIGARWLVTKSSGAAGGFQEKLDGARDAGAISVVVGPPPERGGVTVEEALRALLPPVRRVTLVGVGPGGADLLTREAARALERADALIGAKSVLDCVESSAPRFAVFRPEDARAVLEAHRFRSPALVLRGDTGFFSGAAGLREALRDYEITVLPGIASPVCFAAKLGIPWEDVRLLSLHGREAGLVRAVSEHRRVMALTGGENTVSALCERLRAYGLGELSAAVGERLSLPGERVTRATVAELAGRSFDSLAVLFVENPCPRRLFRHIIPDGEFIRGDAPMTKSEVRSVCLAKLALEADSVVWDIGAGTGPISVECALAAPEGRVWAVERSPEACKLMARNAVKFHLENISVVEGAAPEALADLPAPTHVFLGCSSGDLRAILEAVLRKNPAARVVATAVTPKARAELTSRARDLGFSVLEAVTVSVSGLREADRDPVTVFTLRGVRTDD